MKNKILKILSKPRTIIPIFTVIGIIVAVIFYGRVGRAPIVNIVSDTNSPVFISGSTVDLAFPKSGRVSEVSAFVGQIVHKGEILAKLSAPDQEGLVNQAKGALDLARAEYASLNTQYASTKKQQDLIVQNAYQTLLSSGLEGVPDKQDKNSVIISGTYICDKEGYYELDPYASMDGDTGFSFKYSGLEEGVASVKYDNSVPLGNCGLQVKFTNVSYFNQDINWTINIPNTKSSSYLANYNAYNIAKENRDKVLSDLGNTIGNNGNDMSIEKAKVNAASGAYEAALGAYQNNIIIAPVDGIVNFIDKNLVVGQSVTTNKTVISITAK